MTTPIQRSRQKTPAEKALFAQEGAGKSKVRRRFFGLSQDDEQWIEKELDSAIDLNIQRDGQ